MGEKYFSVKNFDQLQHYKNRSPPWIKLYHDLLDNYAFSNLPDSAKSHLILIWLLASRNNNYLPQNSAWIENRVNATEKVDLEILFKAGFLVNIDVEKDASKPLASCKQVAPQPVPPAEKRREEKRRANGRWKPPSLEQVRNYCTERGNNINAEMFISHYQTNGWMRGKAKVKDWKACVRYWEQSRSERAKKITGDHETFVGDF